MEILTYPVIGILIFIVSWLFGFFVGNTDSPLEKEMRDLRVSLDKYYCKCGCGGNWCYRTICTPDCHLFNRPSLTYREAECHSQGYKEGYEKGNRDGLREGLYLARKIPQEFILKFGDAMKPLEQLKEEFGLITPKAE